MKSTLSCGLLMLCIISSVLASGNELPGKAKDSTRWFQPDDPAIRYTGRIDNRNPQLPRFWQPGVYITMQFVGSYCAIIVNDEQRYGSFQNYLQITIDGKSSRIQTKGKTDTIEVAAGIGPGLHTLNITKDTEANIGYIEFAGILCESLVATDKGKLRRLEFIGNSITCAASSDTSSVPCGKGQWHDQHNAYYGYGPVLARSLDSDYHLSSVSGIGLVRSCCNMEITMPEVYDKVNMRDDSIAWDFSRYQPDIVFICLGQNDGIVDETQFEEAYLAFLKRLREYYPAARLVAISSPMADQKLRDFQQARLNRVVAKLKAKGENMLSFFVFKGQYNGGCDWHPSLSEHSLIAEELLQYLQDSDWK